MTGFVNLPSHEMLLFLNEVSCMEPLRPLKVKVSITLDEEVVKKLRVLAEEDDRQLSSYINLVLRNYLRQLEQAQN